MNIDYDLLIILISSIISVMVVLLIFTSFYYIFYWALSAKPTVPVPHSDKLSKFAVLIAARNESKVISHLLESLANQTYPRTHFDVYVIVESEKDPSIEIAKSFGFFSFVRDRLEDGRRTKGFALQECIDYLWRNNLNYDAYMIFDADNILDSNFIEAMNDLRQTGVRVGLGYRNFTNANTNWLTTGSAIMFSYMNQVTSKGRSFAFHKVTLMGTGYYVDDQIIKDAGGWIFTGMTEDIQLTVYCYYHDINMRYYPLVSFYDEQSTKFKTVHMQHVRWLGGYFQRRTFLKHAGVQHDYHPKRMQTLMRAEFYCGLIPFAVFHVINFITSIVCIVFGSLAVVARASSYDIGMLFFLAFLTLLLNYLSLVVPAILTVVRDDKNLQLTRKNKIKGVLTYAFFFYDFALAFLDGLFHPEKTRTWSKIKHTGEVTYKDIK